MTNKTENWYRIEDGVLKTSQCAGPPEDIVIPEGVRKIDDAAFWGCRKIKSVTLPDGLVEIGANAFRRCESMERINLPDSLEVIGKGAFRSCVNLGQINIPDSLQIIGQEAFRSCRKIRLANELNCVPDIGEDAFRWVDESVPKAFYEAQRRMIPVYSGVIVTLRNLRIHRNCNKLQCTVINGFRVVVDGSCRDGQKIVYFPCGGQLDETFARENNLLRGDKCRNPLGYYMNPNKRMVRIANLRGEISIGLALPVEVLAKYVNTDFLREGDRIYAPGGYPLCSIYIPKEMTIDLKRKALVSYRDRRDSPSLVYVPWGIEEIAEEAFAHSRKTVEVILPDTVTTIGKKAFYDCTNLKNVVIPRGLARIGSEAMANCPKLIPPHLPNDLKVVGQDVFTARDFEISGGVLEHYRGATEEVRIPEGITEIGRSAFLNNAVVRRVIIPDGVTKIGYNAFGGCSHLREVVIPDSVKEIGARAFLSCKELQRLLIPASVKRVGEHAIGERATHRLNAPQPYEVYVQCRQFWVCGYAGSEAERYAKRNNLTFVQV